MCVPCAAAVPELWPVLLVILIALSVLVTWALRGAAALGVGLLMVSVLVWRFMSGARLVKPPNMRDDVFERATGKRSRLARQVRAVLRLSLVATAVGLFISPLVVALTAGTASVGLLGTLAYSKRYEIQRTAGRPIKATVDREAITR